MALEADLLLDRRRLKRRLVFWRAFAAVAIVLAGMALASRGGLGNRGFAGRRIARVTVTGIITEDRKQLEAVETLAKDAGVAAVILAVDSPGGSVAGGESLHAALQHVADAKPLVAVMGGTAASAGYMISLPAARIFARDATLTGSIGVILETGNAAGLLERVGLSAEAITSGPLKDQPSFTRGLTPEGRDYLHGLVDNMFGQFVAMVAAGRQMPEARVRELADGRAYTGQQALKLGLIDEIGGEPEARAWLERERHIGAGLPVTDVKTTTFYERNFGASLAGLWPLAVMQNWSTGQAMAIWRP